MPRMLTAAWLNGNCSLSETLLQRVLFLLDRIESPTISYAAAVGYSAEALAALASNGILGQKFKATTIPRPARFGSGGDLVVRETSCGLLGVAEEGDFIEPLALEENDRWLYEISLSHLVDAIRRDNGMTASGFRNDAGLISVGSRSVKNAGVFSVYLSLPNENEEAVLARCARMHAPDLRQNVAILVPNGPAFSPEARRVLGDIRVLSLWESAEHGSLTLDWTLLEPVASKASKGKGVSRFDTPAGTTWRGILIRFLDGHTVSIAIESRTERRTFAEMNMKDGRNGNPTKQWKLLEALAQNGGRLSWNTSAANPKLKKQIELLAHRLQEYFDIPESPFHHYQKGVGWQIKLQLEAPR
jgi:hypothetical protein